MKVSDLKTGFEELSKIENKLHNSTLSFDEKISQIADSLELIQGMKAYLQSATTVTVETLSPNKKRQPFE